MKYLLLLLCFASSVCFSQRLKPIAAEVQKLRDSGENFQPFDFFENAAIEERSYTTSLRNYTSVNLNSSILEGMKIQQPQTMQITFPFGDTMVTVDLYKVSIVSPNFAVNTDKGVYADYQEGIFYRGIISNDPTSVAAFSFYGNELAGFVSSADFGDITLTKLRRSNDYIIYSSRDLILTNTLYCGSGTVPPTPELARSTNTSTALTTTKCVRMYYELNYTQYTELDSDMTTVTNWLTSAHNNLAAVYANDGISSMAISEVFVWTTPDDYQYSSITGNFLVDFTRKRTSFNGDIACLLTGTQTGFTSAAALFEGFCATSHGEGIYSDHGPYFATTASTVIEDFPVYSWTVYLLAHESGHVLGAGHTHDCIWNGDNTQIDDWGSVNSQFPGDCYDPENPILPPLGEATIMSYGPQSLSAGFGLQVAQLFIDNIENSPCFGTDCESSCTPTITSVVVTEVGLNSAKITINDTDPNATSWNIRILPGDFYTIDTNPYIITGLSPDEIYRIEVQQQCGSPFTADYRTTAHVLTAGYYCDEFVYAYNFTNPPPYMYSSYSYETALYPVNSVDKVGLTVYSVNLEQDDEILYVHDGPNAESPIIGTFTGITSVPEYMLATGPTGVLTLRFVNDGDPTTGTGWLALATCVEGELNIDDAFPTKTSYYPNPVTDILYLKGPQTIRSVTITDMLGRIVLEQNLDSTEAFVKMEKLSSGNYVVVLNFDGASEVFKVIKE